MKSKAKKINATIIVITNKGRDAGEETHEKKYETIHNFIIMQSFLLKQRALEKSVSWTAATAT